MFNDELNAVKRELTGIQKGVALPHMHPKHAGHAHWARFLKKRIERSMMVRTSRLVEILLNHASDIMFPKFDLILIRYA